jgi:hypothetical protein
MTANPTTKSGPAALDQFISHPDIRERFSTTIEAPADVVMDVATSFDLHSLRLVRAIFWLREKLMRVAGSSERNAQGLLAEVQALGWGVLVAERDHLVVCGATCQPWMANVRFAPIPAEKFAVYAESDQVKIAWSLEAESLGPTTTRFSHETRAVATDGQARIKFCRYWRWARFGIVSIRLLLMPAIRRASERRWSSGVITRR